MWMLRVQALAVHDLCIVFGYCKQLVHCIMLIALVTTLRKARGMLTMS